MIKRLAMFLASAAAIWAVTFALAWVVWTDTRDTVLVCSLSALLLCLVPTTLTFLWSNWGLKQTPDQQLVAVLGGTGIRMFFVLGLGLLLSQTVPYLHEQQLSFWMWILIFYLATLALEMVLIVRSQAVIDKIRDAASPVSVPR